MICIPFLALVGQELYFALPFFSTTYCRQSNVFNLIYLHRSWNLIPLFLFLNNIPFTDITVSGFFSSLGKKSEILACLAITIIIIKMNVTQWKYEPTIINQTNRVLLHEQFVQWYLITLIQRRQITHLPLFETIILT